MKHHAVSPLWVLLAAIPEEKQDHPALHCFLFSRRQQKHPLLGQQPQPCVVPLRLNLPSSSWWGKVSFSRGGNAWLWRGGDGPCWFAPVEDLAHPARLAEATQNTRPSDCWSSSHHLPVWSGIICQTPAAASAFLMGTLVIMLQPAWRMWDVAEVKMITIAFAQIICGLLCARASIMCGVSVKQ